MAFIELPNNLMVKIRNFDNQHQTLVALVNELYEAMKSRQEEAVFRTFFSRLVDQTKTHFADEERLMQEHGYAGYEAHKLQHDILIRQVVNLNAQLQQGQPVLNLEVLEFLKDWLLDHIVHSDLLYVPFLTQRGVR